MGVGGGLEHWAKSNKRGRGEERGSEKVKGWVGVGWGGNVDKTKRKELLGNEIQFNK